MKQLGFNRRHCSACDPQKGYLHGTTSLTQAANGCSRRNGRRRHVIARGTVNSDEQHPVLTAPLRDAHRTLSWPQKSSLFLFRTDGMSCSRELVTGTGTFRFSHPSTQQHLLVWRDRPKVVMVIKKLGNELLPEFLEVVEYLLEAEQMHVVVEPAMYEEAAAAGLCMERLFTFTPEECGRSGCAPAHCSSSSSSSSQHVDGQPSSAAAKRQPSGSNGAAAALSWWLPEHQWSSCKHTSGPWCADFPARCTHAVSLVPLLTPCTSSLPPCISRLLLHLAPGSRTTSTLWCAWAVTASSCTPRRCSGSTSRPWCRSTWAAWASLQTTPTRTSGRS
eukprot:GHRQ01012704.1.p1 GENE.GHRQ01012704.1~~GHRQ01012704.1.p1  ORF type:complete len:333 (+),score=59.40 GHRQ01012704.1:158-1156(+)